MDRKILMNLIWYTFQCLILLEEFQSSKNDDHAMLLLVFLHFMVVLDAISFSTDLYEVVTKVGR